MATAPMDSSVARKPGRPTQSRRSTITRLCSALLAVSLAAASVAAAEPAAVAAAAPAAVGCRFFVWSRKA